MLSALPAIGCWIACWSYANALEVCGACGIDVLNKLSAEKDLHKHLHALTSVGGHRS